MLDEQISLKRPRESVYIVLSEERNLVLRNGHMVLRNNANLLKSALMEQSTFNEFIEKIEQNLSEVSVVAHQARFLAILFEVNVRDTSRIGEPLFETLRYDLQTKASGEFEFIPGDRNLAKALLSLIEQDREITRFFQELCEAQSQAGVATPFDYRRLTLGFRGDFTQAKVADWIEYFRETPSEVLENFVELGRPFASTRAERYSPKEERLIEKHLRGRKNLLDIGGSIGVNARHIMGRFGIPWATVTDIRTEEELQKSFYGEFKKHQQIDYVLGEEGDIVRTTPNNEQYCLVTVNNVLVHIVNKERALNNILPRVGNNGLLVIKDAYNANPPRVNFWIFQRDNDRIRVVEKL